MYQKGKIPLLRTRTTMWLRSAAAETPTSPNLVAQEAPIVGEIQVSVQHNRLNSTSSALSTRWLFNLNKSLQKKSWF